MRVLRKILRMLLVVVLVAVVLVGGLAAYVALAWEGKLRHPDTPYPDVRASTDPAIIEQGRWLVHGVAHCSSCHGDVDLRHPERLERDLTLKGGLVMDPGFGLFYPANLTSDRETGIGAWSDREIARVVRTGVRKNGDLSIFMKLAVAPTSDEDLVAIVSYLRTLAPVKNRVPPAAPNFMAKALVTFGTMLPDPAQGLPHVATAPEPSLDRGRYLVEGPGACRGCHTRHDPGDGFAEVPGQALGGGDPFTDELDPTMEYAPPNLTPSPEGLVSSWSEDLFLQRFHAGRAYKGSPMPWENLKRLSDTDVRSIYRYLRTVRPVRYDPGGRYREAGWSPPEA